MITGYFISVDIPQVPPGEDIIATIDFYAINPGAYYWATFLIADIPALGTRILLDKARETGEEGGRQKTYNLGTMPDGNVAISLFLFAHDDAGYDWDWGEYEAWLRGYSVEITHLASEYVFLTPGEIPPEELDFDLAKPTPSEASVVPGTAITLTCPVTSRCPGAVYASIKVIIYEGSVWPAHGDKIAEYDSGVFSISPNETRSLVVSHVVVAGTIDRRDVQVEVYVDDQLIKESEWDDVYYVTEAPPEEPDLHGYITVFRMKEGSTAEDAKFLISFMAYAEDSPSQVLGWETKITLNIDSYSNFDQQNHIGREGHRTDQEIRIGFMEPGLYTATVILEAKNLFSDWIELDRATYTVEISEEAPPPPPPECHVDADCPPGYVCVNGVCVPEEEVKKFPWLPVALIGGGAAVAIVAAKPKKIKA